MPRLGRSKLLRRWQRWSGPSGQVDRRSESPREAEARRLAAARAASRGSV